jgi:amino acid transporter
MPDSIADNIARHGGGGMTVPQYFALALGSIVGIGWMAVIAQWIVVAGPLGAAMAFLCGALAMLPVGFCYSELGGRFRTNGGTISFVHSAFGSTAAFFTAWLILFTYLTVPVFLSIAVGWLSTEIFPWLRGPPLYSLAGATITAGQLAVALLATLAIAVLNLRGGQASARMQQAVLFLIMAMAVTLVAAGIMRGSPSNLLPLVARDASGSVLPGLIAVITVTPWFLSGFEGIAQGQGERADTVTARGIALAIGGAILAGSCFYGALIFGTALAVPRQVLAGDGMVLATAIEQGLHSPLLANLILFGGLLCLFTSWNGAFFTVIRILSAMGQQGLLWSGLGEAGRWRISPQAIVTASLIGLAGALLGENLLQTVIAAGALSTGLLFAVVCMACMKIRRADPSAPRLFGPYLSAAFPVIGVVTSLGISVSAFVSPVLTQPDRIPPEWYLYLALLAGIALRWRTSRNRVSGLDTELLDQTMKT